MYKNSDLVIFKCLTELYMKFYYFNLNIQILNTILLYITNKRKSLEEHKISFFKYIMRNKNHNFRKLISKLKIKNSRENFSFIKKE